MNSVIFVEFSVCLCEHAIIAYDSSVKMFKNVLKLTGILICERGRIENTIFAGFDDSGQEDRVVPQASNLTICKTTRPSLAKIILSLDGSPAKQQALSHILSALHIMHAR